MKKINNINKELNDTARQVAELQRKSGDVCEKIFADTYKKDIVGKYFTYRKGRYFIGPFKAIYARGIARINISSLSFMIDLMYRDNNNKEVKVTVSSTNFVYSDDKSEIENFIKDNNRKKND